MKNLLLTICLITQFTLSAQFVCGNLIYDRGYDYKPSELFEIGFLNTYSTVNIDNLNNADLIRLLLRAGINKDSIIEARATGSSLTDRVELFFAYKGKLPGAIERTDVWVRNQYHSYASYAGNNILIVPQFTTINEGLDTVIQSLAESYRISSFMVKPFNLPELPFKILAKQPKNGEMADMRYIANSVRLIPYFKELNWKTIWYNESGKPKSVTRPTTGWPK